MTKEQLLAEIEDVIRAMPPWETFRDQKNQTASWLGRASAALEAWSDRQTKRVQLQQYVEKIISINPYEAFSGFNGLVVLLHQAQNELRMQTTGPVNLAVSSGMVFDYFEEIRKIIEFAKQDLLFVDPYLDAEFVSRYLPHVSKDVFVRLLARERIGTLLPAVIAFTRQYGISIEIKSSQAFHDRYVFVDKVACYQSGASFKDGAKSSPTTLTQITDAFPAVMQTYEDLWIRATPCSQGI